MDKNQKKYIQENANRMSIEAMARFLGVKERKVRKFLEEESPKNRRKTFSGNSHYFLSFSELVLIFLSLAGLGLLIYSNTFLASFHWDDFGAIINNPDIHSPHFFSLDLWRKFNLRAVGYLTFILNYKIHGLDVFGYHFVNIAIHIFASSAVFFLVFLTLQTPTMKTIRYQVPSTWISLSAALIFLVHPIQTQAVTYIVQRFASLSALFYVSSLVFYVQYRLGGRRIYYFLSLSIAVFAFLTKENAVTLPLAFILYEGCFLYESPKRINHTILSLAPFFLLYLLLFLRSSDHFLHGGMIQTSVLPTAGLLQSEEISRADYLLTQFSVMVMYLRLLFLPLHQNLDPDILIAKSFFEPHTALCFLFLLTVFALGIFLFKKQKMIAFGILFFFLALSVESSFIPLLDVMNEHRLYLPMVGFCFFLCGTLLLVIKNSKRWILFFLLLTIAGSFLTYERNKVWANEYTLWEDVARKSPQKWRPYYWLGQAYLGDKQYQKAVNFFSKAIQLNPNQAGIYSELGLIYLTLKDYPKALEVLQKEIALHPDLYPEPYNNAGNALNELGRSEEAIESYKRAIKIRPDYGEAYANLCLAYFKKGDVENAKEQIKALMQIKRFDLIQKLQERGLFKVID